MSAILTRIFKSCLALCVFFAGCMLAAEPPAPAPLDPAALQFFENKIRPILADNCYSCHSEKAEKLKGKLYLDSREGVARGGEGGAVVLPGDAEKSRLILAVRYKLKDLEMPPDGALKPAEVAALEQWVKLGAPDPRAAGSKLPALNQKTIDIAAGKKYWAFQPLQKSEPPAVAYAAWCRSPLDRFVLAKLEENKLVPSPEIDRRRLIRRVYFDLTGLPPEPEKVEAFVKDSAPDAYTKLLDALLASPHYGEKWGRHWLDLARFAESHGFEQDYDRKYAYHYRDFVIEALNRDMPYDQFVQWQLAGDELAPHDPLALKATGFLAAGVHATQITANQAEKERYDELDDLAQTIGTSLLGVTFGCARCHDHKFDPIPTRDYYRLIATFTKTVRSEVDLSPEATLKAKALFDREQKPFADALVSAERETLPAQLALWEKSPAAQNLRANPKGLPPRIVELLKSAAEKRSAADSAALLDWFKRRDPHWQALNKAAEQHAALVPKPELVLVASEGTPPIRLHTQGPDFYEKTFLLARGDLNQKLEEAQPGFPQVLTRAENDARWQAGAPAGSKLSYKRSGLAHWITDVEAGAGPLLARVIVNRLWEKHMGRGIVATPSDFGVQGGHPSHPELLDYLARELIAGGWKLKPVHKLMMLSAAYLQDSKFDAQKAALDPEGRFFWRRKSVRLEAELIRDSMLLVGGTLDARMFGPGTLDEADRRRSVYLTVKRSHLIPMMAVFDAPNATQALGQRMATTIAPQALELLNNRNVRGYAAAFAKRAAPAADTPYDTVVQNSYALALGRAPDAEELKDALEFLNATAKTTSRTQALTDFCQAMFGLNEFLYVE